MVVIFIPRHTIVAGYYGFMLGVHESVRPSVHPFSFPDDNLSKHQWIFTKLGMCIDIVEIWFGIANGQISSIFDRVICPRHTHIFVSGCVCPSICSSAVHLFFCFQMITWVNINGFSQNLVCALILWRSGLGLLMGKFSSNFYGVICLRHTHIFISGR